MKTFSAIIALFITSFAASIAYAQSESQPPQQPLVVYDQPQPMCPQGTYSSGRVDQYGRLICYRHVYAPAYYSSYGYGYPYYYGPNVYLGFGGGYGYRGGYYGGHAGGGFRGGGGFHGGGHGGGHGGHR